MLLVDAEVGEECVAGITVASAVLGEKQIVGDAAIGERPTL